MKVLAPDIRLACLHLIINQEHNFHSHQVPTTLCKYIYVCTYIYSLTNKHENSS